MKKTAVAAVRNWRSFVLATFAGLGLVLAAFGADRMYRTASPHVITFSPGGGIIDFYEEYSDLRRSGRRVIIDAACLSACTMVTLIPADRVCVTPYALLGFHSAWRMTQMGPLHSSEGTRLIWQTYPQRLREMLIDRGWDGDPEDHRKNPRGNKHQQLIYIGVPELYQLWRPCA